MKRKVIKQKSSYTVTLPMKWIKDRGINEDSEIEIEEQDGNLLISTKTIVAQKVGSFEIKSKNPKYLKYVLNNIYKVGYDRVTLTGNINLEIIERFIKCTDYKFECSEIVGRKFENVHDHADYLRNGGCSEIINVLAAN